MNLLHVGSLISFDIPNRPSNEGKSNLSNLRNSVNLCESMLLNDDIILPEKKNQVNSVHFEIKHENSCRNEDSLEEKEDEDEENLSSSIKKVSDKMKINITMLGVPPKHIKSSSTSNFLGIPKIFKVRHSSENMGPSIIKEIFNRGNLETSVDLPDDIKELEKLEEFKGELEAKNSHSSDNSTAAIYALIPKSILYQIPILTFEEFINALINHDLSNNDLRLWENNILSNILCKCCFNALSDEDHKICEKLISFSLMKFNFKNSFHLILLLSSFNSVTKAER